MFLKRPQSKTTTNKTHFPCFFFSLLHEEYVWESISLKNAEQISEKEVLFFFFLLSDGQSYVCHSYHKEKNEKLSDSSKEIQMGVKE